MISTLSCHRLTPGLRLRHRQFVNGRKCLQSFFGRRSYSQEALPAESVKEPLSPLGRHLQDSIKLTGPLTIARYMREVLVNPLSGYYMFNDVFGKEGDFVTSPEISQVFGELCGIWYLTEWMRLGQPSKTQIIEFGPGRGTLMSDMLRTLSQFPHFYKTLTDVRLIEASPGLRKIQRSTLVKDSEDKDLVRDTTDNTETITRKDGVRISWHDGIELVPDQWSFVMAHEFFDALPIHSFEKTDSEWRELLIDIDDTTDTPYNFKIVKSKKPTAIANLLVQDKLEDHKAGDRIDVSPDSYGFMHKIALYLGRNGGTGLAIDYGQDHIQGDTLRAIRKHAIVHPMSSPGTADLSADVDFSFLKQAIDQHNKNEQKDERKGADITAYGPIIQKDFLQSLGIQARVEQLFKSAKTSTQRKTLLDGAERLMDAEAMGRIYKVLAFSNEQGKSKIMKEPVGFENKKHLVR